ncbi:MAG: hypothetical protein HYV63_33305 [Candidatus Schekmanbacteria bacterium]|nr:hypothetical protein [Candidatus Schekmanbacteria bacterium]
MALPLGLLRQIQDGSPAAAWEAIAEHVWATFRDPVSTDKAVSDIVKREKAIADVDLFLATAGWDLWRQWTGVVKTTANTLAEWWEARDGGRAVLILDGLSLREVPWLLGGLHSRGYAVHEDGVTGAELPPDTTPFAKALGFGSRSMLYNNGAGNSHRLPGARTECLKVAWEDAAAQITSEPRWVLWHEWPDTRIHELAEHGKGLAELVAEVQQAMASDGFWMLIERLTQGRRLVITGDHGYAASGLFPDMTDPDQVQHMKDCFKAGRSAPNDGADSPWVPPVDLVLDTDHGLHRYVLGRRKWKVSGGHPTLSHGGLSVLEVLVPFIDVSRAEG